MDYVQVSKAKTGLSGKKQDFTVLVGSLRLNRATEENILALYKEFGLSKTFSRAEVISVCNIAKAPASTLKNLMKRHELIIPADDRAGRYRLQIPGS